jgi:hypothetical protein
MPWPADSIFSKRRPINNAKTPKKIVNVPLISVALFNALLSRTKPEKAIIEMKHRTSMKIPNIRFTPRSRQYL